MAKKTKEAKYNELDQTEKILRRESGLFLFPEAIQGKMDHGLRKFLVLYFDDEEDYKTVLDFLEKQNSRTRSHPDLDSKRLVEILQQHACIEKV